MRDNCNLERGKRWLLQLSGKHPWWSFGRCLDRRGFHLPDHNPLSSPGSSVKVVTLFQWGWPGGICICLILTNVFVLYWSMYLCTLYFSQTAKCIGSKWQNVFVPNCTKYLSQVAKFVCLKLQICFVSNCQIVLHWISFRFSILYIWYLSKLLNVSFTSVPLQAQEAGSVSELVSDKVD